MADTRLLWVTEVHNFGGFFGGDTVTLSATPWPDGEEATFTIDEKALDNVPARHLLASDMLLQLEFAGDRVDRARLLAAREADTLRQGLGDAPPFAPLTEPRIRAYHCHTCRLWVDGAPHSYENGLTCRICQQPL